MDWRDNLMQLRGAAAAFVQWLPERSSDTPPRDSPHKQQRETLVSTLERIWVDSDGSISIEGTGALPS
jgi:hypothetical protein